jgi:transcriptional regulator with PAS, ATPase and Fis domain
MSTMPVITPVLMQSTDSFVARSHDLQHQDGQALADFSSDLEEALRDLEAAFESRKLANDNVAELKRTLDDQNWWGTLKSSFSGEADKNLATMVKDLGTSLGLTQSALRVILKVQTEKNRMLRGFSDALVKKIFKVQQDTHTLNGNQKAAALNFLQELQTQIDEQIRQQDLVDSHEVALQEHAQWRLDHDRAHADFMISIDRVQAAAQGAQQRVAALEAEVVEISGLRQQLEMLASENQRLRSSKAILLRNLLPLAASLIAVVALFMASKG